MIRSIVAIDSRRGLADDGGIPWRGRLPTDAQYFRDQTREGALVMGFRTYEEFSRPLHQPPNYVWGRPGPPLRPGFEPTGDLDVFLHHHGSEGVWIIGGTGLYAQSLGSVDELFVTRIDRDFHCTKFFPEFEGQFTLASASDPQTEHGIAFQFEVWRRSTGSVG
ncbi:MAG TPA: dihydrofolate reductase [Acidimicrobiales bacterium]|nr:dihydrofolate reductase [Acidimicrobiales bacterium]